MQPRYTKCTDNWYSPICHTLLSFFFISYSHSQSALLLWFVYALIIKGWKFCAVAKASLDSVNFNFRIWYAFLRFHCYSGMWWLARNCNVITLDRLTRTSAGVVMHPMKSHRNDTLDVHTNYQMFLNLIFGSVLEFYSICFLNCALKWLGFWL